MMKLQTTASGPSVAKRIEGLAQCLSLPKKMMESGYGFRSLKKFSRRHHWFPAKWRLKNERRNSILMTCHYPDLGSAFDWLKQIFRGPLEGKPPWSRREM